MIELRLGRKRLSVVQSDPIPYYETWVAQVYGEVALQRGDVVLDIGANVGDFALIAAEKVGPRGRVVAVEASPEWAAILRKNVRANGVENIECIQCAVGRAAGRTTVLGSSLESGGMGSTSGSRFEADTVSLDEIVNSASLGPPAVIKIDIEGGEVDALAGQACLRTVREVIVETHGPERFQSVVKILSDFGLSVVPIHRHGILARALGVLLRHPIDVATSELRTGLFGSTRAVRAYLRSGGIVAGDDRQTELRIIRGVRVGGTI